MDMGQAVPAGGWFYGKAVVVCITKCRPSYYHNSVIFVIISVHFLLIVLYCLSIYFKFGEERNSAHVRLNGELQLFSAK